MEVPQEPPIPEPRPASTGLADDGGHAGLSSGGMSSVLRVARELTPRSRDADPVRMLHARVLDSMREGVSVCDTAGVIVFTNAAEEGMFGYAPGEMIGRTLPELSADAPAEAARRMGEMITRLEDVGVWSGRWRCRRRDGSVFVTQARATVMTLAEEPLIVRVQEDVTGYLHAIERADLLADASHALAAVVDFREALETLVQQCVPFLADVASVEIVGREGHIERLAIAHAGSRSASRARDAPTVAHARDLPLVRRVVRSGEPVLLPASTGGLPAEALDLFPDDAPSALVLVPLLTRASSIGVLALAMSDSGRHFTGDDVELAAELAVRAGAAVERTRLYTALHRALSAARAAERREELRAEAAAELIASLDYEAALGRVVHLIVPELADWCAFHLVDAQGDVSLVAAAHRDPACIEAMQALAAEPPPDAPLACGVRAVLRAGRRQNHPRIGDEHLRAMARDDDQRATLRALLHGGALVVVPIMDAERVLGALSLGARNGAASFDEHDVTLAEALAARAASAMDNARLHEEAHLARLEAERASRAKSELLANVSHDLRTPLNAIGGYAQLLGLGVYGPLDPMQHEALERIQRSQQQLLALIDDLLTFTRLDAAEMEYAIAPVDVGEVAAKAIRLIAPQSQEKRQRLELIPADGVRALAESEKLLQALLHLLANAIKFTPPDGAITLAILADQESVRLEVRDTGGGIPEHELEAIFQPLTQLARGYNRPQEGSGMGLAISRELVRGMGGRLTVRSTVGTGSTFVIHLPRAHHAR
jgi:PAS domain S-box-containing protein